MQNAKAFHALVSREDIGASVDFEMTHVESCAAGVGEHVEHIEFGFSGIEPWFARVWGMKGLPFLPKLLPFRFEFRKWKMFSSLAHCYYLARPRLRPARGIRRLDCAERSAAGFSGLARILERQNRRAANAQTPG